jgi:hypothetical protein
MLFFHLALGFRWVKRRLGRSTRFSKADSTKFYFPLLSLSVQSLKLRRRLNAPELTVVPSEVCVSSFLSKLSGPGPTGIRTTLFFRKTNPEALSSGSTDVYR